MFCYQCEQTAKGTGCTVSGVCGKNPEVAALQDLLIHGLKGISNYAHRARQLGKKDEEIDRFAMEALFTTLTNVNFDPESLFTWIRRAGQLKNKAKNLYESAAREAGQEPEQPEGPAKWVPEGDIPKMVDQAKSVSIQERMDKLGATMTGLEELIVYGLKGAAAYAFHAKDLGFEDDEIYAFYHQAMNMLSSHDHTVDELLNAALKTGEINLKAMEILDRANTSAYGSPEPTKVRVTPVKGKAIVISGHDLKDLEELLKQTEGKGINVYTHGEMLPAHAYPELKKYKHLVGNYGGAWQDQRKEFEQLPGVVLMTTNCVQIPKQKYECRLFTTGPVSVEGSFHIADRNFDAVIQAALQEEGFTEDAPEKTIMCGFGHDAVMSVADKVVDAVKQGQIKHFYLIGGCDGAKPGRNYYTEFAQAVPEDSIIMTLACGKYRFNKLDFGDIGGIPRLLDVGQCNDAYSAVQIAVALANAFDTDVNSLPLSLILSWYEQKAVAILLSLLHLGIKDIRLGPSLPAFITPEVLNVLVEKFDIKPITNVQDDLAATLAS